ncbi:MAG: response regulator [Patescibacteria group bacterium]
MNPKVLIIQEQPLLSEIYRGKLKAYGIEGYTANGLEEALEKIAGEVFNLVLLDTLIDRVKGKLLGFEILQKLRAHRDLRVASTPVIMLSDLSQREHIERSLHLGANEYMIKTQHTPNEVVLRIKKMIYV